MNFSFFDSVKNTTPAREMSLSEYVMAVLSGNWAEEVEKAREATSPEDYAKAKEQAPAVTISGTFTKRGAKHLIKHSGILIMDIDEKDNDPEAMEAFPKKAKSDQYIHGFHRSIGGKGFAIIFKIDPEKHIESFLNLEIYLKKEYNLISDKSCKDVSRLRFVSYDPELYMNQKAKVWDDFKLFSEPKKKRKYKGSKPRIKTALRVAEELTEANPTVLDAYEDWIKIGFSLVNAYGEEGRDIFHVLSQSSDKYDEKATDEKYDELLRSSEGDRVTIGSFFKLAKDNGVKIVKNVEFKNADMTPEETLNHIKSQLEGMDKVSEKFIDEAVEAYVRSFNLRYNTITDKLESNGSPILNSFEPVALRKLRKIFPNPAKIKMTLLRETIESNYGNTYNPIKEEIERMANIPSEGAIDSLLDRLVPASEEAEKMKPFVRKWLISIVATVYGARPELCLVLVGAQQKGKTTFFMNLLPESLRPYFKSGTFVDDKDNKFAMTEKLLLLNDEMTGFHKSDWNRFKALISTDVVSERRAYARRSEDKERLAVFAGATNDEQFLSDLTGNRRIIPFEMKELSDWRGYVEESKEPLFAELYEEYMADPADSWRLTSEEVEIMKELSEPYRFQFDDELLIAEFFKVPNYEDDERNNYFLTSSQIKQVISWDNPHIKRHQSSLISRTLKSMGFEDGRRKIDGRVQRGWYVHDIHGQLLTMPFTGIRERKGISPTSLWKVS